VPQSSAASPAFKLLVPEIGDNVVNLKNSESIRFMAEAAPNYGFPTETSYWVEISEDQNFADPAKLSATDTKGKSITYDAPANELDLGIMKIRDIQEDLPTIDWDQVITLYARMVACPTNAMDSANYTYSTVQPIKVTAYFLKEALPEIWYLTGDCVADASWANDIDKVGTGMIPMYVKNGESYNRFTGKGVVEYVGYIHNGQWGFKLISPKGLVNWMYSLSGGSIKDGSGYKSRNGGDDPGNITVAVGEQGYYRLTLNTEDEDLKIEAYESDDPITVYTSMSFGDTALAPMTTIEGAINHDWYGLVTLTTGAMKFTANDGTQWGTDAFPYGIATTDGSDIPVMAGTYKIYFNDITGAFMFTKQK
jgi:hypothetical protein